MAAGQAQVVFDQSSLAGPVRILDCAGTPRWHGLWYYNPAIAGPTDPAYLSPDAPSVRSGHGCLPYFAPTPPGELGWRFSSTWRARDHRAKLYFTAREKEIGDGLVARLGPYAVIEPSGTDRKNRNRCWPSANWHALAGSLADSDLPYALVQLDHAAADRLVRAPVHLIPHADFREACAILRSASLLICPEGGLAHAAAALAIPAVVLWGGCISAETLGYPEHINLVYDHPQTPCGMTKPCAHCDAAWASITPADVQTQVLAHLGTRV